MDNKKNNKEVWVVMSDLMSPDDKDTELHEVCTSLEKAQEKMNIHIKNANSMYSNRMFRNRLLDDDGNIITDEDYDDLYREVTPMSLYVDDGCDNFIYFWIEKRVLC